jgi:hypothetical protein
MIIEVGSAGELLIPAQLVGAAPCSRLSVEREGDALVLRPVPMVGPDAGQRLLDALPVMDGSFVDPWSTFRREDIYESDAR